MQKSETAWLFDVDGVLADPKHKSIDEAIFDIILNKLQKGDPVALNTGRSIQWVVERLVQPLLERALDASLLAHFFVVGEKGGTWMSFDEKGNMHKQKDDSFTLSPLLREKMRKMVEEKFSDCAFFDETKETMISIEMKDGYDIEKFKERQKELHPEMRKIIKEVGNGHKMDPSIIATDIEDVRVGKALGTDRFLAFLKENNIHPDHFIAFGDSITDLEMADELERKKKKVTFIFVGEPEKLKQAEEEGKVKNKSIIEQVGDFTQGTLRYLNK